jgi:hypothetical protein
VRVRAGIANMRFALPEGCLTKVQGGDIVGVLSDIAAPLSSPVAASAVTGPYVVAVADASGVPVPCLVFGLCAVWGLAALGVLGISAATTALGWLLPAWWTCHALLRWSARAGPTPAGWAIMLYWTVSGRFCPLPAAAF